MLFTTFSTQKMVVFLSIFCYSLIVCNGLFFIDRGPCSSKTTSDSEKPQIFCKSNSYSLIHFSNCTGITICRRNWDEKSVGFKMFTLTHKNVENSQLIKFTYNLTFYSIVKPELWLYNLNNSGKLRKQLDEWISMYHR